MLQRHAVLLAVLLLSLTALNASAESANLRIFDSTFTWASFRGVKEFHGTMDNLGPSSTAAELVIKLPPNGHLQVVQFYPDFEHWSCAENGAEAVCSLPDFTPGVNRAYSFQIRSDDLEGGFHPMEITLRSAGATTDSEPANNTVVTDTWWRRPYRVTSSADDGPGTLRQVILDVNEHCTPDVGCEVLVDLPVPSTMEPLTPLPAITGCGVVLEGNAYLLSLDAHRPVTISGRHLTAGNGLELRPACASRIPFQNIDVRGFAIGDFPGSGIYAAPANFGAINLSILSLGTDASGSFAHPNALRGLTVESPTARVNVSYSILSGNGRSGLFIADASQVGVYASTIGVARNGDPLPNGASGIYAGKGTLTVRESTIANHPDFGVALQPGTQGKIVATMHSNGNGAIDWGLNGPSANGTGLPEKPELFDAFYDAAIDRTIVRGTFRHEFPAQFVALFANRTRNRTGRAEMERVPAADAEEWNGNDFVMYLRGDLRGQIITGVGYHARFSDQPDPSWTTSEVSDGIDVR
jgi:hypothetical protein